MLCTSTFVRLTKGLTGAVEAAVKAATFNCNEWPRWHGSVVVGGWTSSSSSVLVVRNLGKHLPTWGETIKAMRDHPDLRVRAAVVEALGQDLPTNGETFEAMRGDTDCSVRLAVVRALGQDMPTNYVYEMIWAMVDGFRASHQTTS